MPRIAWENNVLGFIPKTDWLDVPFQITRPNDPADALFGDQRTDNLVAEWESIASAYKIPVMAQFHGFDTEAEKTIREPITAHNIEKGLIKVKINQSERMRALLNRGVQGDDRLYEYVMNDGLRLAEQVITRTKVAKNELLATGQVTINENNLNLTVDFGVPAGNKGYTISLDEDADTPSQIQAVIDSAADDGVIITGMYTSRKNISAMRKNEAIQTAINGTNSVGALVTNTELQNYLAEEFGIQQIITNDLTYASPRTIGADGKPSVVTNRYYPKNKITFFARIANGAIGAGLWGDPPEADAPQFLDVKQSGESPYVYITQWCENDPAVLWTKASSLFMPVLYAPDSLHIATVTY